MKDNRSHGHADLPATKVLIVSVSAPPKGTPESLQVSKYLKYLNRYSLELYLVTEAVPKNGKGWTTLERKYQTVLSGLKQVIEVPLYRHQFHAVIRRVNKKMLPITDDAWLFTRAVSKVTKNLKSRPDIIYSRSTPYSSAVLAKKLKRIYGVPWIMHLSDPWVLSPFFNSEGVRGNYQKKLEQECFDQADIISITSKEQIAQYEKAYPQHKSKLVWFPNVYDDDEVAGDVIIDHEKLCFLHSGNFYGPGRSPEPVLKAVRYLYEDNRDYLDQVEFLFTGHCERSVHELFRKYTPIPAKHLGVLPLSQVLHLQKESQVLIIIDWELPQEQAVFLLSKAIDYMAARKPMLAVTTRGSTIHKLIDGVYGRCFEHHDTAGIVRHLKWLIDNFKKSDGHVYRTYQVDMDYSASGNAQRLYDLIQNFRN